MAFVRTLPFALVTLGSLLACSAGVGSLPAGSGGNSSGNGGAPGSGGALVGSGGAVAGLGGAQGLGGTLVSSGGAVASSGGAASGAGGGGASEVTCAGTAFSVAGGYVDDGTWCGYAFTSAWGDATVMPAEFDSTTSELCASGVVPVEDPTTDSYPGIMVGFQVQAAKSGANTSAWKAAGTGISFNITATGAANELGAIRIMVKTKTGPTDGYSYWAPAGTTTTVAADWSDISDAPWAPGTGESVAVGDEIVEVGVQIGSRESGAQTISELCINSATRT
jgi:hypothetical protein